MPTPTARSPASEGNIVVRCDGRTHPSIGETIRAAVDHGEVRVFRPETDKRIG